MTTTPAFTQRGDIGDGIDQVVVEMQKPATPRGSLRPMTDHYRDFQRPR